VSGLIYAGRAGGRRTTGKLSTNTLWGRIATMHLAGNREFSTFRLTLAAVLHQAGEPVDDDAALSAWMKAPDGGHAPAAGRRGVPRGAAPAPARRPSAQSA
jgi:hypothetical protein